MHEWPGARSEVSDPCAGAARHWHLDPTVTFLNHGSFGACPIPVMKAQSALRLQLEREPVRFFLETAPALARQSREQLGAFIGADPDDLAFLPNATTAVNLVLRSLHFAPGDQILATSHGYRACLNAAREAAERESAELSVVQVPFPLAGPEQVIEAVLAAVTPRTRLAVLDHVTSPTGVVFPIETLVAELQARGVDVLVDGAHALGMLPLDLTSLGAAYYTANAHKWLCAPKGAAFLHVRRDRQDRIRPLVVSHGASSPRTDVSRFRLEFDWMGTDDPSPHLCLPACLTFLETLTPEGIPGLMGRNRALAQEARRVLAEALGAALPCPDSMLGSLASLPLPDAPSTPGAGYLEIDPLQQALWDRHRIEVPIVIWPGTSRRWVRISAQAYNTREQYETLGAALRELLA
ncbi:MAG TPA: aminotransferase class V-fold PLP-dependent enzyme [Candidatus Polarisedimenticolaceae bacterium]|nr:aminotransferase class V-fold PLP-dependent enzyme [Candidatus Polarisedimenticolaceae bacterium]